MGAVEAIRYLHAGVNVGLVLLRVYCSHVETQSVVFLTVLVCHDQVIKPPGSNLNRSNLQGAAMCAQSVRVRDLLHQKSAIFPT